MRVERTVALDHRGLVGGKRERLFLPGRQILQAAPERLGDRHGGRQLRLLGEAGEQLAERAQRNAARLGQCFIGDPFILFNLFDTLGKTHNQTPFYKII